MSSSCKILICLVQNACRKKCCLLIQHVTFIFMFALIKYIFDCLWLLSFFSFFFFFSSYLFHLVDKHTGNLPLSRSDHLVLTVSLPPLPPALSQVLTFIFLNGQNRRGKENKTASLVTRKKRELRGGRSPEEGGEMAPALTRANKCFWLWRRAFQGNMGSRRELRIIWSSERRRPSVILSCLHRLLMTKVCEQDRNMPVSQVRPPILS